LLLRLNDRWQAVAAAATVVIRRLLHQLIETTVAVAVSQLLV
jgi:hypothetical protein